MAKYLGSDIVLKHGKDDAQLLVAWCIVDIFRVFAPKSPYEDPDNLKVNKLSLKKIVTKKKLFFLRIYFYS